MKILYVTPLWNGLGDILIKRKKEAHGMPAFINPLKTLVEQGHSVDLVIATNNLKIEKVENHWLSKCEIYPVPWMTKKNKLLEVYKSIKQINRLMKSKKYDFVYCHGSFGALGGLVASIMKVPFGQRIYGTFLYREINLPKLKIALRHPLEYLAFTLNYKFLLITNDGTKGDKVFEKLNKGRKRKLYFWLNGVEKNETLDSFDENFNISNDLIYPARITRWKRQHLAIELVNKLREKNINVNLSFFGHIDDPKYKEELDLLIKEYSLENQVTFHSTVSKKILYDKYKDGLAVLSFYEVSNLGNVAIEAMNNYGIIVACNDGSMNGIIKNNVNGFLINNIDEASNCIEVLLNDNGKYKEMKINTVKIANEIFESWEERIEKEISLIENIVNLELKT